MKEEKDEELIIEMLELIADLKLDPKIDISILTELSRDERPAIRQGAIKALGSSASAESRYALFYWLTKEEVLSWKAEIVLALNAFEKIGRMEDNQNIKKLVRLKNKEIHNAAERAISAIYTRDLHERMNGEEETDRW